MSQLIEKILVFLRIYLELRSRVSAKRPTKNQKKDQKYPVKNLFSSRYSQNWLLDNILEARF